MLVIVRIETQFDALFTRWSMTEFLPLKVIYTTLFKQCKQDSELGFAPAWTIWSAIIPIVPT